MGSGGATARLVMALMVVALVAPAAAGAAFPGANGKIAFARGGDIWTMDPDGSDQVNLTNTAAAEDNPAWSADGNRIAFDRLISATGHRLFVMFADGSGVTQVPSAHEMADPAWSPDGTRLAFWDAAGQFIGTVKTDGTGEILVAQLGDDGFDPEWSPDGADIAFTAESNAQNFTCWYDVFTTPAGGSGNDFENVTCPSSTAAPFSLIFNNYATWSPDGTRIAFTSDDSCPGCTSFLESVARDGTDRVTTPVPAGTPAYSPDGSKIVFGNGQITVVDADGTGATPITSGTPSDSVPDWQPLNQPGPEADVLATITDAPDPVPVGGILTYDVSAKNLVGPDDATGATLTVNLPANAFFISAAPEQGSCSQASGTVTCNIGNLPQGSSVDVQLQVEPRNQGTNVATATVAANETDPVPGNNVAQTTTAVTPGGYPRPKSASPVNASLVPAYRACNPDEAGLEHGPPLAHPSCGSPAPASGYLTVGTPDANGRGANSVGAVRLTAIGEPSPIDPNNGDQADIGLELNMTDVRSVGTLADYAGDLRTEMTLRLTDQQSSPSGFASATVTDTTLSFDVPCTTTGATNVGATCAVATTAEALVPSLVTERRRGIFELGRVRVFDGGADGDTATGPNTLFAVQGIFVP